MKKLKVGIVGLGVGEKHIDGYHSHESCEVVKICDFNQEKLDDVLTRYPHITSTTNSDDVLTDPEINVVTIASFDNFHHDHIIMALDHDKHVFVEKPLCLHDHEARNIRKKLNEKPHLRMSSNLILRKSPRFIELRKEIHNGAYGNLFYLEADYNYGRIHKILEGWRGEIDDYSVYYGGAIHMVDLLRWLTGEEVKEVFAYGNKIVTKDTKFRYPDTIVSLLKFKNDMIAKVVANYCCVYPHFHKLSVYGTDKTFENGWPEASVYTTRDPNVQPEKISTAYPGTHKGDLIYNFIDSILNQSVAEVTEDEMFKSMCVCFAAEKSVRTGQPATVDYI